MTSRAFVLGADARAETRRRVVDVVGAGVLLLVTAPVLAAAALAVLLASGRPIFFRQVRVGWHGRPFRCWKLRTMVVDAEDRLARDPVLHARYRANGFKLAVADDPRITRVGGWLRRTYLDELPQLFNVLAGSMTLVGPRPIVSAELAEYDGASQRLLALKPGLFGPWVARGLQRPSYPERAQVELEYFAQRSLRRDLGIILRCIPAIFRGEPQPRARTAATEEDAA